MTLDVFVVAPIRLHREAISWALDTAEMTVVGEAATVDEALLELQDRERPTVVLVDVRAPADREPVVPPVLGPDTRVVVVGIPDAAVAAWAEAGIAGFVPAEASLEEAIAALEKVAGGEFAAPPQVTAQRR